MNGFSGGAIAKKFGLQSKLIQPVIYRFRSARVPESMSGTLRKVSESGCLPIVVHSQEVPPLVARIVRSDAIPNRLQTAVVVVSSKLRF